MERKLAAILVADVVGYSRLVGQDEEGTIARLEVLKSEIIDPLVTKHQGRVFKQMGDGLILEFPSIVNALECGLEWQEIVEMHAVQVPKNIAIRYRMGLNLGDIVVKGEDVLGNGVNVAARLESIAEPGTIFVSKTVCDHANNKSDVVFENIGEKRLKNIAEPIAVYRAVRDGKATRNQIISKPKPRSRQKAIVAITAVLLILVIGAVFWFKPWQTLVELASPERMTFALPDKPSVAILPFTNISNDKSQEYFADGMTDDLITDLSKVSGLFVIARNSTFVYKGKTVKIKEVAEDLGVRYVLEGSVRQAGEQIRVNAQLIDATNGGHVWAERYDGKVKNIFAVQDDFVRQIVKALALQLSVDEKIEIAAGKTIQIEAREAFQNGWEHYLKFSRSENAKAVTHFERAIELDPEYGRAYAALALVFLRGCNWDWNDELGLHCSQSELKANHYLSLAEKHPTSLAHIAKSLSYLTEGVHDKAFKKAKMAIAADPNDPEGHLAMGWVMTMTGKPLDGLGFIERAMRLNPVYPAHYALARGIAYFANDDPDKAAEVMAEGLEINPGAIELAAPLAAMYGRIGNRKKARELILLWKPTVNEKSIEILPSSYTLPYKWSSDQRQYQIRLLDGLFVATLPFDITVPVLLAKLEREKSFFRRLAIIRTIGYFGPLAKEAVPALTTLLSVDRRALLTQVVATLGKIGPGAQAAVPSLRKLLQGNTLIKVEVTEALQQISGQ